MSTSTPALAEPRRTSPAALTCAVTACALGVAAVSIWGLDVGVSILLMSESSPLASDGVTGASGWEVSLWFAWRVLLCVAVVVTAAVSARAALSGRARRGVIAGVISIVLSIVPIVLQHGPA